MNPRPLRFSHSPSPLHVQVLVRGSVLLNLCLVLYLSLSAGWNFSSSTQALNAPYARDIQFFGKGYRSLVWDTGLKAESRSRLFKF